MFVFLIFFIKMDLFSGIKYVHLLTDNSLVKVGNPHTEQAENGKCLSLRARCLQPDRTHLSSDLLFDALLRLGQSRHRRHVGPAERPHHRLEDDVSKQLPRMGEEDVENTISNLKERRTDQQKKMSTEQTTCIHPSAAPVSLQQKFMHIYLASLH